MHDGDGGQKQFISYNLAKVKNIHIVFLTFDIEDFIGKNSIKAYHAVLQLLENYDLRGLFFITGHMAERIREFPALVRFFKRHEIGYHSSGHSVRPTLFEYTDVNSYEKAYQISLERETSHINPFTGEIEGVGGIYSVRDVFPANRIVAFRAPGLCWSPPHLEALRDLGIKFDFSSDRLEPALYKGITFYPYPIILQWHGSAKEWRILACSMLRHRVTVLCTHPNLFVYQEMWDSIYWSGNPNHLPNYPSRKSEEIKRLFFKFDLLLRNIKMLENTGLIEVGPPLIEAEKEQAMTRPEILKCYEASIQWPLQFFNYRPKFLKYHFFEFFRRKGP